MNVFVAGGSGAIGMPLVRALVSAGHQVTAMTRSNDKAHQLRALGASVAVADALDREAVMRVVEDAHPTHIVHQLTALPKDAPRREGDLEPTNRLRIDGTRNLLEAAINAGARRFVVGSFAILADRGQPAADAASAAVHSMEQQTLEATERRSIEGVILRYGMFYGVGLPSTDAMIEMVRRRRLPIVRGDQGQLPFVQIDDAISATILALDRAPAGGVYDIVDDRSASFAEVVTALSEYTQSPHPLRVPAWLPRLVAPYLARITAVRMPLSNAAAKAELGWRLKYPTFREGLAPLLRRAA
jgi:nucleoside-diphosphate-sugar epimerase